MSRIKYPLDKLSVDFTVEDVTSTFRLSKPRATKLIKYWLSKKYIKKNGENYIRLDNSVAKHNVMDVTDPNPLVTEPVVNQTEEVKEPEVIDSKDELVEQSTPTEEKPIPTIEKSEPTKTVIHKHDVLYKVTLTNSTTMELKAKSVADAMNSVKRLGYPDRAIFKIEEM